MAGLKHKSCKLINYCAMSLFKAEKQSLNMCVSVSVEARQQKNILLFITLSKIEYELIKPSVHTESHKCIEGQQIHI